MFITNHGDDEAQVKFLQVLFSWSVLFCMSSNDSYFEQLILNSSLLGALVYIKKTY